MAVGFAVDSVRDQRRERGVAVVRETTPSQANLVRQTFDQSGFTQLRNVTIETHPAWLCLRGEVSSYFLKQIAQVLAGRHVGEQAIRNDITVGRQKRT